MKQDKFNENIQELYTENCNSLLRKIKDLYKWKDIFCPWIGNLNIVKMSILLEVSMDSR